MWYLNFINQHRLTEIDSRWFLSRTTFIEPRVCYTGRWDLLCSWSRLHKAGWADHATSPSVGFQSCRVNAHTHTQAKKSLKIAVKSSFYFQSSNSLMPTLISWSSCTNSTYGAWFAEVRCQIVPVDIYNITSSVRYFKFVYPHVNPVLALIGKLKPV